MIASLKAARGRCQIIIPELCVDYLEALRQDRKTWRAFVEQRPSHWTDSPQVALAALT